MEPSGPSFAIVFGCVCIAPLLAVFCVILLVWLAHRSRENLPADAIITCQGCGREMLRTKATCPHCGQPANG